MKRLTEPGVRELLLHRRRSRVPWVYLVYGTRDAAELSLPAQERGDVQRRRHVPRIDGRQRELDAWAPGDG
jgi:hypothetical protein